MLELQAGALGIRWAAGPENCGSCSALQGLRKPCCREIPGLRLNS